MFNILCPHCGKSHYMVRYTTTTAMYFPVIMKDGVNINPDRNISTTYCECIACGTHFWYNNRSEIGLDGSVINDTRETKLNFNATIGTNPNDLRL